MKDTDWKSFAVVIRADDDSIAFLKEIIDFLEHKGNLVKVITKQSLDRDLWIVKRKE